MTDKTIWGIHMRRTHGLAPIEQSYIAIGWREMGDSRKSPANGPAITSAYAASAKASNEPHIMTMGDGRGFRAVSNFATRRWSARRPATVVSPSQRAPSAGRRERECRGCAWGYSAGATN